jgi:YfiR/HmsC-like
MRVQPYRFGITRAKNSWSRWVQPWLLCCLLVFCTHQGLAQAVNEYQIKAAFLFNFAQFVEWPAHPDTPVDAPFVIGILGDDPFDGALEATVRDEKINDRPFVIHYFQRGDEIKNCAILFVSHSEAEHIPTVLAKLNGRDILTVSDADEFARLGGMMQFVTENKHVHLKINVEVARKASITISSKLLRPSEIVSSGKG